MIKSKIRNVRFTHFWGQYQFFQQFHIELKGNWCKFTPKIKIMARQSITFTKPNNEWLKERVKSQEYSSKSELVNDLIRQARNEQARIDWVRHKIEKAEKSDFTSSNKEEILAKAKDRLNE